MGNGCALFADDDFAASHHLIVQPQAIFVATGFGAGNGRTGEQAHAHGGLKNVGGKRAAFGIEFDAKSTRVRNPADLVAGIEHHGLGNQAD
jgi:hypothetical protein